MAKMKALVCRECGKEYPPKAIHVCEMCFGPLEVKYNYDEIKGTISRQKIEQGPQSMWRYIDLLPVESSAIIGPHAGLTPMVRAKNLGAFLGIDELYIKNDTVNHPTLSFKDRVVSVALTRARELGFETVACASTGNLANSVAAHAAAAGMKCYVFIPADLEAAKVLGNLIYKPNVVEVEGNYDDVNRLCSEIAGEHGWAFVNINIRPYYAEGSKTLAFETVEPRADQPLHRRGLRQQGIGIRAGRDPGGARKEDRPAGADADHARRRTRDRADTPGADRPGEGRVRQRRPDHGAGSLPDLRLRAVRQERSHRRRPARLRVVSAGGDALPRSWRTDQHRTARCPARAGRAVRPADGGGHDEGLPPARDRPGRAPPHQRSRGPGPGRAA